jgi:hypothetical protein
MRISILFCWWGQNETNWEKYCWSLNLRRINNSWRTVDFLPGILCFSWSSYSTDEFQGLIKAVFADFALYSAEFGVYYTRLSTLSVRVDIFIHSHFSTKSFFLSLVFSILEHPRSSLFVPLIQASVSAALSSSCLDGRSKPVNSLSLNPSWSCPRFNLPKAQDRCERGGKGGAGVYCQRRLVIPNKESVYPSELRRIESAVSIQFTRTSGLRLISNELIDISWIMWNIPKINSDAFPTEHGNIRSKAI